MSKVRTTHHHGHTASAPSHNVDTEHHETLNPSPQKHQGASPQRQTPGRDATPQPDKLVVHGVIPALQRVIDVPLVGCATLADLITAAISIDTRLAGCKVAFRGKFLTTPEKSLHSLGIRDGDSVHLATGMFTDVQVLNLFRIEEEFERAKELAARPNLTEIERQGLYEELMRVLFRTDELQDLEGDMRTKRKDLVKRITALQDSIKK